MNTKEEIKIIMKPKIHNILIKNNITDINMVINNIIEVDNKIIIIIENNLVENNRTEVANKTNIITDNNLVINNIIKLFNTDLKVNIKIKIMKILINIQINRK
jgi:hypothetical protein